MKKAAISASWYSGPVQLTRQDNWCGDSLVERDAGDGGWDLALDGQVLEKAEPGGCEWRKASSSPDDDAAGLGDVEEAIGSQDEHNPHEVVTNECWDAEGCHCWVTQRTRKDGGGRRYTEGNREVERQHEVKRHQLPPSSPSTSIVVILPALLLNTLLGNHCSC